MKIFIAFVLIFSLLLVVIFRSTSISSFEWIKVGDQGSRFDWSQNKTNHLDSFWIASKDSSEIILRNWLSRLSIILHRELLSSLCVASSRGQIQIDSIRKGEDSEFDLVQMSAWSIGMFR